MTTAHREIVSTLRVSGLISINAGRDIKEKLESMKDDQRESYLKGIIKQCAPIARRQRGG